MLHQLRGSVTSTALSSYPQANELRSSSKWVSLAQSGPLKASKTKAATVLSKELEVVQTQRNPKLALVNTERPGITAGLGSFSPGTGEPHPSLRGLVLLRLRLFRHHSAMCSALGEWELELREEHWGDRLRGSEAIPPCSTRCSRWVSSWCCYSNTSFFLWALRNPATLTKKSVVSMDLGEERDISKLRYKGPHKNTEG